MREIARVLVSDEGLLVALLVIAGAFALRQIWTIIVGFVSDRRQRARLIAALYAEIDYNTRDVERFLATALKPDAIKAALRAKDAGQGPKVIHITDARHTMIYAQSVERLTFMPRVAIYDIVAFYNQMEKIKVQIEALGRESFGHLTDDGRDRVVDTLWESVVEAARLGRQVRKRFESERKLNWALERHVRRASMEDR